MKKQFIIIVLFFLMFAVVGCSKSTISKEMLIKNLEKETSYTEATNNVLTKEFIRNNISDETPFSTAGVIITNDATNKIGCWSLFANGNLFEPVANITVDILTVNYSFERAHYVKVTDTDNNTTIYDVYGNIVVEKGKYHSVTITGRREEIEDEVDDSSHIEFYEDISVLTISDFDKGISLPTKKTNIIGIKTKTRTVAPVVNDEYFEGKSDTEVSLKKIGLDGYYGKTINTYIYIYNKDNKLVNTINLKDLNAVAGIDGKFIIQTVYLVDNDSDDYTYLNNQNKYLLKSYSIDLLTGKEKELKLDYLIDSFEPYMNNDGKYVYGFARIKEIVYKTLSERTYYALVNSQGEVVVDAGPFDLIRLVRLGEEHFYDRASKTVLDNQLNPIRIFNSNQMVNIYDDLLILNKDGLTGAIHYDGKIGIPFEYTNLSISFHNGRTVATHIDGNRYIVDTEGNKTKIDVSKKVITMGLLYETKYNNIKNVYEARMLDYELREKIKFEYTEANLSPFFSLSNIYGDYMGNKYGSDEKNRYILIDISHKQ